MLSCISQPEDLSGFAIPHLAGEDSIKEQLELEETSGGG